VCLNREQHLWHLQHSVEIGVYDSAAETHGAECLQILLASVLPIRPQYTSEELGKYHFLLSNPSSAVYGVRSQVLIPRKLFTIRKTATAINAMRKHKQRGSIGRHMQHVFVPKVEEGDLIRRETATAYLLHAIVNSFHGHFLTLRLGRLPIALKKNATSLVPKRGQGIAKHSSISLVTKDAGTLQAFALCSVKKDSVPGTPRKPSRAAAPIERGRQSFPASEEKLHKPPKALLFDHST
jgi:hypothetical protein